MSEEISEPNPFKCPVCHKGNLNPEFDVKPIIDEDLKRIKNGIIPRDNTLYFRCNNLKCRKLFQRNRDGYFYEVQYFLSEKETE